MPMNVLTEDVYKRQIKHSAARLKALATMIKNLETHKADLEQEIEKFNRDLAAGKISKEEAAVSYTHLL